MPEFQWTHEQAAILSGGIAGHMRVLAGPGTGKSAVVVALAEQVAEEHGVGAVHLATFTRAATAELADRAAAGGFSVPISTVHSLSLRLLRLNPEFNRLPLPIRIPDDWETRELIHADIRSRLAARGWPRIRRSKVERLEREMAARWESLDDELILLADLDPDLRSAFVATWQRQRAVFGYSLFAEMPWYAYELLEDHPDANIGSITHAIVDEYQDLNPAELGLLKALSQRIHAVVAVGDDEQSIYSWRMAAPRGIQTFPAEFPGAGDHTLTISHRCSTEILTRSQLLIASSPTRVSGRPTLQPGGGSTAGEFAYLRFANDAEERLGVAELLHRHHDAGVPPERMAILVRADHQGRWTRDVLGMLETRGIPVRNIEAAVEPLGRAPARSTIAMSRLVADERDDLAWWTLLKLKSGCSDEFIRAIADSALTEGIRFSDRLRRLSTDPIDGSAVSRNRTLEVVDAVYETRAAVEGMNLPALDFILQIADQMGVTLEEEFFDLVVATQERLVDNGPGEIAIRDVIGQLEPTARDLALEAPGVAVMTIARSKGLTFDVVVTMGVEDEIFSADDPHALEEMRRLLYVAMTRAKRACLLTMATYRADRTAFSFDGSPVRTRSRSNFLSNVGIHPQDGNTYIGST